MLMNGMCSKNYINVLVENDQRKWKIDLIYGLIKNKWIDRYINSAFERFPISWANPTEDNFGIEWL